MWVIINHVYEFRHSKNLISDSLMKFLLTLYRDLWPRVFNSMGKMCELTTILSVDYTLIRSCLCSGIQWTLAIPATLGTNKSGCNNEVAGFQSKIST